jgi:hypothetical protein
MDREKVIKGLEAILEETADMFYRSNIQDALALLKAQEPRVLSVAEIFVEHITPDVIWIERRHENDICPGVWQIDHYEMGLGGIVDDLGEEIAERPDAYNVLWRCWTSRPTKEQMEMVKWE